MVSLRFFLSIKKMTLEHFLFQFVVYSLVLSPILLPLYISNIIHSFAFERETDILIKFYQFFSLQVAANLTYVHEAIVQFLKIILNRCLIRVLLLNDPECNHFVSCVFHKPILAVDQTRVL